MLTSKDSVDTFLSKEIQKKKTPSLQYYFFDQRNILFSCHYGFADIANKIPVTDNTTYNAFSVTKTFTAVAVLQLQDKNLINIDHGVKKYLPEFPYQSELTIKNLLNHSSGIPNPIPLQWTHLIEEHANFNSDAFFNTIFERHKNLEFLPNKKFHYSNLGFVVLGKLIEKVSGLSYEDYIKENILRRLGLTDEDLNFVISNPRMHAKGYQKMFSLGHLMLKLLINENKYFNGSEDGWKSFKPFYVNGPAYGGLIGKPKAFVVFLQELLKANSSLLSPSSMQLLLTEGKTNAGKRTGMCLSWFKGELNKEVYFAHAGGGGGYYCEIRFYPGLKKGSVIFFNRSGWKDERFLDKTDRYLISHL